MRDLNFRAPPTLAVAENAATPTGTVGALIWSTTASKLLAWDGSKWASPAPTSGVFTGPVSIDANSATTALRITQTGTGNALVVEDSTSPDSTPFAITAGGNILAGNTVDENIGGATAKIQVMGTGADSLVSIARYVNAASPPALRLAKSRGSTVASNVTVQANDVLGQLQFYGADGSAYTLGGEISVDVDGTPGVGDMPGRMVFRVTADGASSPTERLRITSAGDLIFNGKIGLGTPASPSYGATSQVLLSQGSSAAPVWSSLKTVNGNSLIGTGDIVISGGGGGGSGDVVGPAAAAADSLVTFADATGKVLKEATFFDVPDIGGIPAAPAADHLRHFARNRAGRVMPHFIGPAGIDVAMQPALFGNSISMWTPSTGTTVSTNFGTSWTARNSGTGAAQAHPARASTNALTSLIRATFGTGTTATGSSGIQSALPVAWRGNAANLGGFYATWRFAVETLSSDIQLLIGLSALNAALAGEPSTQNNTFALCKDAADTTWHIVSRSTTLVKTNLAVTITAGQILDFTIFAPPNGSGITVRLVDAVTGTVLVDNVQFTGGMPSNTTFLHAHAQIRSTTTTTAKLLALNRIYVETDL